MAKTKVVDWRAIAEERAREIDFRKQQIADLRARLERAETHFRYASDIIRDLKAEAAPSSWPDGRKG